MDVQTMEDLFDHDIEGCFLYSRHFNPSNKYLADALARMEGGESAQVMSSGMAAISTTLLQFVLSGRSHRCRAHDLWHGTYAFLKNVAPRSRQLTCHSSICVSEQEVRKAVKDNTKVIYCEEL